MTIELPDGFAAVKLATLEDEHGREYRVSPALADLIARSGGTLTVTLRPQKRAKWLRPIEAARLIADRICDRDEDPVEHAQQTESARQRIYAAVKRGDLIANNGLIDPDSFSVWAGSGDEPPPDSDRIRAAAKAIRVGLSGRGRQTDSYRPNQGGG